jgi:hypothetical protein
MMHDSAAARLAINLSASELSGDEQKCIQDALAFFECYPKGNEAILDLAKALFLGQWQYSLF